MIEFQWRYVQPDRQIPSMKVSVSRVSPLSSTPPLGPGSTELTYPGTTLVGQAVQGPERNVFVDITLQIATTFSAPSRRALSHSPLPINISRPIISLAVQIPMLVGFSFFGKLSTCIR